MSDIPSPTQIARYLGRIGFAATPTVDLATLAELHRRHVETIPWECLDAFAGRPTTRDPRQAFDKIVGQGRGGWCYEMNGLFAWMLEGLGFDVRRLAAGVMRDVMGDDAAIGNHLLLVVRLDRDYLADVGLGSGLIEPIPLVEGSYRQRFASYRLERLDERWWRFHNQPNVMPPSFDFALDLGDEALLEGRCRWLQTDRASPFVNNAVVQRYGPDRLDSLAGTVWTRIDASGVHPTAIEDAAAYAQLLDETFGVTIPDVDRLWARLEMPQPAPVLAPA
jgi:N-hydroxyarylamine O-acetyltransferase